MAWGIAIIVYTIPFWIWQMIYHYDIERRKKRFPGREQEAIDEKRFTKLSLYWCAGLVAMLIIWKLSQ